MTSRPHPYLRWTLRLLVLLAAAFVACALLPPETWARVGGGGSYGGGGGGSGGGGGGGGGAAVFLVCPLGFFSIRVPALWSPFFILFWRGGLHPCAPPP